MGYFRSKEDAATTFNMLYKGALPPYTFDRTVKTVEPRKVVEKTDDEMILDEVNELCSIPPRPYTPLLSTTQAHMQLIPLLDEKANTLDYGYYYTKHKKLKR